MTGPSYTGYAIHTITGTYYEAEPGDGTHVTIGDPWVTITGNGADTWIPTSNITAIDVDANSRIPDEETPDGSRTITLCAATDEGQWPCTRPPGHVGGHVNEGRSFFDVTGKRVGHACLDPVRIPSGPTRCYLLHHHDGKHSDGTQRWG